MFSPRCLFRGYGALLLAGLAFGGACNCGEDLGNLVPSLIPDRESIQVTAAVAEDTEITVELINNSGVSCNVRTIELTQGSDPAVQIVSYPADQITITPDWNNFQEIDVWVVPPGGRRSVTMLVRPEVVSTINATLFVEAEPSTLPSPTFEVPITIDARDLGLPDIVVNPTQLDFERIGQGDVVRDTVVIENVGVRDLIIDETTLIPGEVGESPIRITTPVQPGWALGPGESITVDLTFAPLDTDLHTALLQIVSSDPDEPVVDVPIAGAGSLCPVAVAELLDDPEEIEPLDTLRLDGRNSMIGTPGTEIVAWEWVLEQRPVGSTAILYTPTSDRTEITADIAGDYQVRLSVTDSDGIRSCEDAVVRFTAKPTEDLHVQLVWDHPSADLDLHFLKEGGEPFTHEGDTYFSNKQPEWFPDNPESNPGLDVDDDEGYGPENVNIEHPLPGSKWTVLVHYWNKQTDGDPFTIATLRIYAYGQQVLDISQSFEEDETLWTAVEIQWSEVEDEPPSLTQLGQVEAFPRPF